MRRTLMMAVFVIAGTMLLFAPLAAAGDDQGSDKAKQGAKEAKKKAQNKANKKKANKKKAHAKKAKKVKRSASASAAMSVIDAKTTTKVEDRQPVGASDSFNTGDKVTVWLSMKNPNGPNNVELVFFRNDVEASTIELEVGKSWRWRTWARRTVGTAGDWKVEVRDDEGNSLKTLEFKVE